MPNKTPAPAISSNLYLGLLFAQEDAGGSLIPGLYSRTDVRCSPAMEGEQPCGCIHGAAMQYGGIDHGLDMSAELTAAGLYEDTFDDFARQRIALNLSVTVDSTLLDCNVSVQDPR